MSRTTIVVPCYNEAERLPVGEFLRFASSHANIDFVMVDDGSRDRTLEVLHDLQASSPRQFHVLPMPRNGGKAEAVRAGLNHALANGADFVGFLDADLAAPLSEVPRLVEILRRRTELRVVVGSRLPLLGHTIRRRRARRWLGRCFANAASYVLGLPIRDTQCGLKLFRGDAEIQRLFARPFQSRWIFDVEILARLIAGEGRAAALEQVYEAPLERWSEIPGSKLKGRDFATAIVELARIYATYLRRPTREVPGGRESVVDIPAASGPRRAA